MKVINRRLKKFHREFLKPTTEWAIQLSKFIMRRNLIIGKCSYWVCRNSMSIKRWWSCVYRKLNRLKIMLSWLKRRLPHIQNLCSQLHSITFINYLSALNKAYHNVINPSKEILMKLIITLTSTQLIWLKLVSII